MSWKNVFSKLKRLFDFSNAIYSNIRNNMIFNFPSGRHTVEGKRCKFFYDILLQKKVQRPCYQNTMSKIFSITDRMVWKNVYQTKVKLIDDPIVSEFNYKLLNNLLNNYLFLSRWKTLHLFVLHALMLLKILSISFLSAKIYRRYGKSLVQS